MGLISQLDDPNRNSAHAQLRQQFDHSVVDLKVMGKVLRHIRNKRKLTTMHRQAETCHTLIKLAQENSLGEEGDPVESGEYVGGLQWKSRTFPYLRKKIADATASEVSKLLYLAILPARPNQPFFCACTLADYT